MKKLSLLAVATMLVASASTQAVAADGSIDFIGEVGSSTCVINGGTAGPMTVTLPRVQVNQLTGVNATAAHTRFVINLTGCSSGSIARAFFEANGNNIHYPTNSLKNQILTADKAAGIGFAIFDEDRQRIQLGLEGTQGGKVFPIASGAAQLGYEVAYIQVESAVTAGKIRGTVEYSIKYD